jgi:hypothetical protein
LLTEIRGHQFSLTTVRPEPPPLFGRSLADGGGPVNSMLAGKP